VVYTVGFGYFAQLFTVDEVLRRMAFLQERVSSSGGIQDFIMNQNILVRTVVGSVFMLVKPFPPTSTLVNLDIPALMTIPTLLLLLLLMPYIVIGIWSTIKNSSQGVFIIVVIAVTLMASAASVGAATVRYRVQLMPLVLILMSVGFYARVSKRVMLIGYYGLLVFGVMLYILLKAAM
jgi:hypothetical protein